MMYRMNVREYVDCESKEAREDWENHIFGNIFERFISALPLNPPEVEIDGVSKVREEVWTDGIEILCADEATAERIANILDAISGEHEAHIGYYDPFEDAQNGEVDDHTGFYYVDYD